MVDKQAVVICHGIGIGGEPYAYGLAGGSDPHCLGATADCHIFCPEVQALHCVIDA